MTGTCTGTRKAIPMTTAERPDLEYRVHGPAVRSRRALLAVAALLLGCNAAAVEASSLVDVDIYDRMDRQVLDPIAKAGTRYIVGTPGHEYAIRIRNDSGQRILAVTSVDGVNVLSGDTASPQQSGYVIEAGGSVEISGWRTSLERTSAFYFTDLGDSYAARTGRPRNVGVIGVAVFRELSRPLVPEAQFDRFVPPSADKAARADAPAPTLARPESAARSDNAAGQLASSAERALASKIGTGFGRDEASPAQRVRFERATATPAETVAIQYDRRENLIAMGVLPSPRYAQRMPDPFPAMRFVPAPR
jgi:hypothetical protein